MLPREALCWASLVCLLSLTITSALGAVVAKRQSASDSGGDNGEGVVETYMMARDLVQDEINKLPKGMSPDPNGDAMQLLDFWRNELKRSGISKADLPMLLKGDPGVPGATNGGSGVQKRTIEAALSKRWTKGIVPFIFTNDTNAYQHTEIKRAMDHYHRFTCIRYVPWETVDGATTNEKFGLDHSNYLMFVVKNGCWSHQGNYRWQGQEISCCGGATCIHELGHAMGELHEQQSPNPDRNRFIRVNRQYILDNGYKWYFQKEPGNFISHGYDFSSPMHYAKWMFRKGKEGETYTYLFPELKHGGSFYYIMREVSIEHKCQDQCKDFPMTCENEGYLSKIDNKCGCRCIGNLDPSTGCTDVYKKDPAGLDFPGGQWAIPAAESGCPDGTFLTGSRKHYNKGGNTRTNYYSLKAEVSDDVVEEHFCVRDAPSNDFVWPEGNYCIHRVGGQCPEGFFTESSVQYDDSPSAEKPNAVTGKLPDGVFGDDTTYQYCCKNSGFDDDELYFPSRQPFVLIRRRDENCQKVRGMILEENSITVANAVENGQTTAALEGDHPVNKVSGNAQSYTIKYCHHKPAMIDCGGIFELSSSNREITFSSPDDVNLQCHWLFKAPMGERLSLDFSAFDIRGFSGQCNDELEVRYARQAQPGIQFCGKVMDTPIVSINNTIYVRLATFTKYYKSHFTATVKLIQNDELCYAHTDRGMSYDGDINFTRFRKPCLPWHEMTHCEAHPFKYDIYNTLLTGNECRTPDPKAAFQPWCYIDKETCGRDYCDVCLKGKLVDRALDCEQRKANGQCDIYYCAKTCLNRAQPSSVSQTRCGTPPDAPDGKPVKAKSSYQVGETVEYQCDYNRLTKTRRCLSSGQWDTMGQVCTECPSGWHKNVETNRCYVYHDTTMTYSDAKKKCKSQAASLTTAKSQAENDFIRSLASAPIWIGLTDLKKEGTFVWEDGEALSYSNWNTGEPNNWYNLQHCVEVPANGLWNDRGCAAKYGVVCSRPVEEAKKCLDFWDKCPEMLLIKPSMCADFPDFANAQCRLTCNICVPEPTSIPPATSSPTSDKDLRVCSKGWVMDDTGKLCYKFLYEDLTFREAAVKCKRKLSAALVKIQSQEENDWVSKSLKKPTWIGVTDAKKEGKYIWMDKSLVKYFNWAPGQPNNADNKEDCLEMGADGQWNDVDCDSGPRHGVCVKDSKVLACLPDWEMERSSKQCYKFVYQDFTFQEAATMCKQLAKKTALVSIKSKDVNDWVAKSLKDSTWIGATDVKKEGKFIWMDKSKVKYSNWADGEPSKTTADDDCVDMNTSGEWGDIACDTEKRHAVCERPASAVNAKD